MKKRSKDYIRRYGEQLDILKTLSVIHQNRKQDSNKDVVVDEEHESKRSSIYKEKNALNSLLPKLTNQLKDSQVVPEIGRARVSMGSI